MDTKNGHRRAEANVLFPTQQTNRTDPPNISVHHLLTSTQSKVAPSCTPNTLNVKKELLDQVGQIIIVFVECMGIFSGVVYDINQTS